MSYFRGEADLRNLGRRQWTTLAELIYHLGPDDEGWAIKVPPDFHTDLSSVPPALTAWYPPDDDYVKAAVVHDFLYARGFVDRPLADAIFLSAMKDCGTARRKRWLIYLVIRLGGGRSYAKHQRRRERCAVS